LLSISVADLKVALTRAADLVAAALHADKVDAFLYDVARDTLVAVGTSNQPLSTLQRKHGLDTLSVANGGRAVEVYQTGATFVSGNIADDPQELRGVKEALSVRSEICATLEVAGKRRGVLLLASLEPGAWSAEDTHFTEAVARWVGAVIHQAELVREIERSAASAGRRTGAEELVTVLAHDLRNFIHPADLSMQLAEQRAASDRRGEDVRDITRARRALARLNAMVTDILDVARIDQGIFTVDVGLVSLAALVTEVATVLSTEEQPVLAVAENDVCALVDQARIRQCVENLVINAIKHSPKRAAVRVVLSRFENDGAEIARIEVIDEGPGVAPDVLPHVFERFVIGPRQRAGLGLGLFLARQIALMHHGDLTVQSEPSRGARFILTLPCNTRQS
jgi:signal transduction histidine kinase